MMEDSNEWGGIDDDEENEEYEGEDEYFSGRDSLVLLIDCGRDMFENKNGDGTPFELSMKCAKSIMTNKIISSDKDLIGIVFYGTETSDNPSNFQHITVFQELKEPGAEKIIEVGKLLDESQKFSKKYGHNEKYSLSDALWACSSMFSRTEVKVVSKRILLFTNNDNPHAKDNQLRLQAQRRAADIADTGISLDLMHIQKGNGDQFDVDVFYRELIHLPDGEEYETIPDASEKFEELLTRIRSKHLRKRRLAAVPFMLWEGLSLGVGVYTLSRPMRVPPAVTLNKEQNENLKVVRKTYCETTGEILFPAEINKYATYGNKNIVFDRDELKDMRKFFDPGLVLLGFKPHSALKLKHFVTPSSFIYPDEDSIVGSTQLFAALLERCGKRDKIAICRYTPRRNTPPYLVALLPQKEELDENNIQVTPPGFHLVKLPFSDDIRKLELATTLRADKKQIEIGSKLVKKLQFKYDPDAFENPVLQTHWRNIEALALDLDNCEDVVDYTKPSEELMKKRAGSLIQEFTNAVYPPGYNPSKPAGKRTQASGSGEPSSKREKVKKEDEKMVDVDVKEFAKTFQLEKLTMDILKTFCVRVKIKVTGKRKADLISDVYDYFKINPQDK